MRSGTDERAISPVIGVALLLVIVVALVAVSGMLFLGLTDQLVEPAPVLANEESIQVRLEGNETDHRLQFVHQSGESVPADTLRVVVTSGGQTASYDLDSGSAAALSDGSWSTGEKLSLTLDESTVCAGGGESADVELVYEGDRDSSFVISDRRVPIERGQFVIDGDSVRTTSEFTANVKFLGTGWSSPTYDAPVNVSVRVNGNEVKAWEMVEDSTNTVGAYGVSKQSAGTSLTVIARGKTGPGPYYGWRTTSADENAEYLTVLRDGDEVPNYEAGNGQQSAAAYADPFINDTGYIDLADNQAVFLFDFNRDGPENADYQDAVVLVSFFAKQQNSAQVYDVNEQDVIVCPAETKNASPNGGGNGNNGNNGNGNGN